jgi:predicted regulator of Ras-like GTPase activity (Roadblock/LC7/MglB family)
MTSLLDPLLEVNGVVGALLLSQDGLPVASANLDFDEAETVGALATALVAHMRGAAVRLAGGELQGVRLACDDGTIDLRTLQDLMLVVFEEPEVDTATLGVVLPEVQARCLEFAL